MLELQANTEVKVRIGPFVDVGDGYTPQTDIDVATADEAELLKHNGAATVDISGNTWAAIADCDGWYDLTLSGTDTNTEGLLTVVVQDDSDCLPVYCNFMVLAQAAWLSKYTAKDSGLMSVDTVNLGGTAQTGNDVGADVNEILTDTGTTLDTLIKDIPTNAELAAATIANVTLVDTCTANSDMRGTDNAALASVLGSAVGADISADIAAVKSDTGAILTDTGTTLNDKIDTIDGNVDSILTDTGTTIPGTITTLTTNVGTVDTVVDGIQTDLSNGTDGLGALKALIDAVQTQVDTTGVELTAAAVDAIWDETITSDAHSTANSPALYLRQLWTTLVTRVAQCGDAGSATTIDLDDSASSVTDYYKGQLIAITAGTGAGQARACTAYNGTSKVATVGPAWETNPDGDSWFAVLNIGSTVVAAIDDIDFGATMKASIETACDSSLTSYDAPTKTEMDTAHALLATPAQVNAQVLDCLVTDTHAELAAVPAATSSLKDKINWLFALSRNKITQTATTQSLRNDADGGDIATSTVSDDGTTAVRGEFS